MPNPTITNEQRHENLAEFMKNFLEKHHEAIHGIQIEHNGDHTIVTVKTNDVVASDFIRMSNAWHSREQSKVQPRSPVELTQTSGPIPKDTYRVAKLVHLKENTIHFNNVIGFHMVFHHGLSHKHLTFTALEQKLKQSENLKTKIKHA